MKSALLFVFIFLIFTTVHAQRTMQGLVVSLANAFSLDQREVEKCINKAGATLDDFEVLDNAVNEDSSELNKESIRRATCAGVCCAQVQGTMTGAKIEIQAIHRIIRESTMPPNIQHAFHANVDICHNQVKDITNECELGYRFVKCVVIKSWELNELRN